jgi:hypothetical protein
VDTVHSTQQPSADTADQLILIVEELVEADPTPAEILHAAALYLRRHGWTQGTLYRHNNTAMFPPACADGAICVAVLGRPVNGQFDPNQLTLVRAAEQTLADHLTEQSEAAGIGTTTAPVDPFTVITDWNDEGDRTVEHVIAALQAAAHRWSRIHGGAW